jgi:hypothetical protein
MRFESLEGRYCLAAPTIDSFQIDSVSGTTVSVSGYVTDESPETVEVDFSGALEGSTYANGSGYFSYSGEAQFGTIDAVALDEEMLSSDSAEVTIESDVPVIDSLSVTYGYHTEVTITGQVIDEDPGGLYVYFTGAVEGYAETDSSGNFSLNVPSAWPGTVQAAVADGWGQLTEAWVDINGDNPPEVTISTDLTPDGLLTIQGTVTDEDAEGLTVIITFRSEQYEVTTDCNGDFFHQIELDEGEEGLLTIIARDWWTLESDPAQDYIIYEHGGY